MPENRAGSGVIQTCHLLDSLHGEGQGAAHGHTSHQAGIVVGKEAAGHITGDMSGSFFANNYPCLMAGVAMGRTLTFAMKAVKQMAGLDNA